MALVATGPWRMKVRSASCPTTASTCSDCHSESFLKYVSKFSSSAGTKGTGLHPGRRQSCRKKCTSSVQSWVSAASDSVSAIHVTTDSGASRADCSETGDSSPPSLSCVRRTNSWKKPAYDGSIHLRSPDCVRNLISSVVLFKTWRYVMSRRSAPSVPNNGFRLLLLCLWLLL